MRDSKLNEVAIIGTGLVGCGWAIVFALGGASVRLFDADRSSLDSAHARIGHSLRDMRQAGLLADIESPLAAITVADSLSDAVDGVQYVQESVYERLDIKTEVAGQIGGLISPDTVVGSSSSGIPASAFTQSAPHRNRFLIVHPVNPPHLIPVVELVPSPWTDPGIISWLQGCLKACGQVPVEVRREIDGFILNRLQGVLLNEAWALYEEGYASIADIDATVSQGLGLRWAFMGPFETIDLNAPGGVADYAERLGPLYHAITQARRDPRPWSPVLIDKVAAERRTTLPQSAIPERCDWRDRRLMHLVAHLRGQKDSGNQMSGAANSPSAESAADRMKP